MAISLRTLFESVNGKEEMSLVAGEGGLDRDVRWVHMVEGTDISSFLRGDELVFTTGIALRDASELYELVACNYEQKASAMVINVGPYVSEIPQKVIDFGNENDFPIFCVPWKVHMANIMRSFIMQINMEEMKELELETAVKNAFFMPKNKDLYMPMLQKHGYKPDWSYTVATVEVRQAGCEGKNRDLVSGAAKTAANFLRAHKKNAVVVEQDHGFSILFCNVTGEKAEEYVNGVLEWMRSGHRGTLYFYAGIGSGANKMASIGESHLQSLQTTQLQRKRGIRNVPLSYGQAGLYKLLFALRDSDVLEEYYGETLGVLEKYDNVNETDLLYFLGQFVRLEFSVQDTAAKMHLHRNSVTYKLHKIEEIIHMNINDPMNRTKLMVAFMIREIR